MDAADAIRLEVTTDYMLKLRKQGVSAVGCFGVGGLTFHFKLRCWIDITKSFVIRQALKGWRKEYVRRESRRPISYLLLVQLLEATDHQCSSIYEASLFRDSFCLAFFAALHHF